MGAVPNTNIRTMQVGHEKGVDVKNTSQLKPGAHKTSAEKEKNVTTQYTTRGIDHGPGHDGARNANV